MLRQLLVGTAISVCNIAIHALMMATVVHMSSRMAGAKDTVRQSRGAAAARERPQKNSRMYGTFETVTRLMRQLA